MKYVTIGTALLFLSACATTSETASAPAAIAPTTVAENTADETDELDPNEEVCRRQQRTGSRFHTRICMTRAEWAQMQQDSQDSTRAMQREVAPDDCVFTSNC